MIPQPWYDEWLALRQLLHQQSETDYVFGPNEAAVTSADIEALSERVVTAAELAVLSAARGQYRDGDTRRFVMEQEQYCEQCNCWMLREADGSRRYVSEPASAV